MTEIEQPIEKVESPVVSSPVFETQEQLEEWMIKQATPENKPEHKPEAKVEVVEKPVAEAPKTEQPVVVDFAAQLSERFGGVTEDAIKEALNRPVINDEDRALIDELKYFKENPWALELAKYASKPGADVPLYAQISRMDVQKLKDDDALVLDLVFEKGLTKEEAQAKVRRDHNLALTEDGELDADEKLAAGADMKLQANEARKRLAEYQQRIKMPEGERVALDQKKEAEQREAQRMTARKPEVKKIVESYAYSHKGDFGAEDLKTGIDFKMPLTAEQQKQYQGIVENLITNPSFDATKDSADVAEIAAALFERQNREVLLGQFARHLIEKRDATWAKKVYGIEPGAEIHKGPDSMEDKSVKVHDTNTGGERSWKW